MIGLQFARDVASRLAASHSAAPSMVNEKQLLEQGAGSMPYIEFQGKQIEIDNNGYIIHLNDWSEELATHLAAQDGIILTDAHWEVIHFLRDYYRKYQIAPVIKTLVKEMGKLLGPEKGTTRYIYELYAGGPAKQACRYAGLPKPTGCV